MFDAYNDGRILLTEDKDFGELVYRLRKPSRGIVLIRIDVKKRHLKWERLKKLIEHYPDRLPGNFVVIDLQKYRFRPLIFELQVECWDKDKPDGTFQKLLDISKIKKLGWKPNIDLKNGIRSVYEWYLKRMK